MYHIPTFHPHDPSAPLGAPDVLRKPARGLSAPCVTASQRARMQAAAAAAEAAIEALMEACGDFDLLDIAPNFDSALVEIAAIASNKVELETKRERAERHANGWLTEAEAREYEEDQAELRALNNHYNTTRYND